MNVLIKFLIHFYYGKLNPILNGHTTSVADPDPWNPYNFSGSVSKNGWIRNPDPYQIIRIRIQLKPLKT